MNNLLLPNIPTGRVITHKKPPVRLRIDLPRPLNRQSLNSSRSNPSRSRSPTQRPSHRDLTPLLFLRISKGRRYLFHQGMKLLSRKPTHAIPRHETRGGIMENDKLQHHMDGAALAAKYNLGVPLKRHTHNLGNALGIGCAVIILAFCLLLVLGAVGNIMQQPRVIVWWIVLLLGVLALLRLALLFMKANQTADRSVAYECSEGFVIVSGSGQAEHVLIALRWDEITQAWKEREKLGWRRRPYGDPSVKYYIRDQKGRQHRLEHRAIWRRCQKELASRGLPEDRSVI
jgi:hypothetical protein